MSTSRTYKNRQELILAAQKFLIRTTSQSPGVAVPDLATGCHNEGQDQTSHSPPGAPQNSKSAPAHPKHPEAAGAFPLYEAAAWWLGGSTATAFRQNPHLAFLPRPPAGPAALNKPLARQTFSGFIFPYTPNPYNGTWNFINICHTEEFHFSTHSFCYPSNREKHTATAIRPNDEKMLLP